MAFGFLVPAATNWYLAAPVIFLLALFDLLITIGVLHMHTNRHLFVSHRANRVVDVLCCLPGALTAADMREVHVLNHHRFNDGFMHVLGQWNWWAPRPLARLHARIGISEHGVPASTA